MLQPAIRIAPFAILAVWLASSAAMGQVVLPRGVRPGKAVDVPSVVPIVPPAPAAQPKAPPFAPPLAPAAQPEPTKEQKARIDGWIRQLEADEFYTRETAMLQLLDVGPAVLPSLRPVLTGGSLEATSRALFVVGQIGLTADLDAAD